MAGMLLALPQVPTPAPTPEPPTPSVPPQGFPAPSTPGAQFPVEAFGQFRVPQTPAEAAILRARRAEMSNQIISARDRRGSLARQYERATGANKAGLEQQLKVLDQRIAQLEVDIGQSGQALASYTGPQQQTSLGFPDRFPVGNLSSGQITGIWVVFIVVVLGPLAGSFGRLLWRRSPKTSVGPGWEDASRRLERLEQAVDTIAVEIERVSESQRFMTKIMTQRDPSAAAEQNNASAAPLNGAQPLPALGAGSAEPIVLQNQREEVRTRRS